MSAPPRMKRPGDRDATDVLRSMKKYVAIVLGDEWEVRLSREQGTFQRPFARVARVGPVMYTGSALVRDATQAIIFDCFPERGSPDDGMDGALLNAMACEELLFGGFQQGVDRGRPCRVPLYDYSYVSLRDESTVRHASEYMRVNDFSTETNLDPDDQTLLMVTAQLRVAWRRIGALSSPQRTVEQVTVEEGNLG